MSADGPATYLRDYLAERGVVVDDLQRIDHQYVVTSGSRRVRVQAPSPEANVVVWALHTAEEVVDRLGWPDDDEPTQP